MDKLQRRAVSIIEGRKIEHHEINHTLSWPSLESRRKYQIYLQMFKCLNGLAPAYLLHDFHYSLDFHVCNTQNKDLLRLPLAKTSKYQSSFRYNGAKAWNDLPYKLRIENSLSKFKKGLKLHFCTPKSSSRDWAYNLYRFIELSKYSFQRYFSPSYLTTCYLFRKFYRAICKTLLMERDALGCNAITWLLRHSGSKQCSSSVCTWTYLLYSLYCGPWITSS